MIAHYRFILSSVSKFKAILLEVPEKLHRPLLVFITPLGNAGAINMMRMKSFHVYLTAPRRVPISVLTQHSAHVKDLTHHLVLSSGTVPCPGADCVHDWQLPGCYAMQQLLLPL